MFIPLLAAKVFHIVKKSKNLKNVKRVYPKIKSKGEKNKMVKRVKEYEPHQKKDQGKCASLKATIFYSYVINNCVQLVIYAAIDEQSNNLSLISSYLNFMF